MADIEKELADGLAKAGVENIEKDNGVDASMRSLAKPIADAIRKGGSIRVKGSASCEELSNMYGVENGDIYSVSDSGSVMNGDGSYIEATAGDLLIFSDGKWTTFLHIDLTGYATDEELSSAIAAATKALSAAIASEASRRGAADESISKDLADHEDDKTNPHGVTATQVKAVSYEQQSLRESQKEQVRQNVSVYSKEQVDGFIRNWSGYVVVPYGQQKPEAKDAELGKIYLVQISNDPTVNDKFEEWISDGSAWSLIGERSVNLEGYVNGIKSDTTETFGDESTIVVRKDGSNILTRTALKLWNYIKVKADAVYSAIGHKHGAGDITSGTFGDDRIASASTWNGKYSKPSGGIPKGDLAQSVQTSLGKADTALQSYTETDPTVPAWAKEPNRPTYTANDVGAAPATHDHDDLYYPKAEVNAKNYLAAKKLTSSDNLNSLSPVYDGVQWYYWESASKPANAPSVDVRCILEHIRRTGSREIQNVYINSEDYYYSRSRMTSDTWGAWKTSYYQPTSTYSATGTRAVNGTAVASAIRGKVVDNLNSSEHKYVKLCTITTNARAAVTAFYVSVREGSDQNISGILALRSTIYNTTNMSYSTFCVISSAGSVANSPFRVKCDSNGVYELHADVSSWGNITISPMNESDGRVVTWINTTETKAEYEAVSYLIPCKYFSVVGHTHDGSDITGKVSSATTADKLATLQAGYGNVVVQNGTSTLASDVFRTYSDESNGNLLIVGRSDLARKSRVRLVQNGVISHLGPTTLTAARDWELPDASGTIALTSSDITGNAATATKLKGVVYSASKFSATRWFKCGEFKFEASLSDTYAKLSGCFKLLNSNLIADNVPFTLVAGYRNQGSQGSAGTGAAYVKVYSSVDVSSSVNFRLCVDTRSTTSPYTSTASLYIRMSAEKWYSLSLTPMNCHSAFSLVSGSTALTTEPSGSSVNVDAEWVDDITGNAATASNCNYSGKSSADTLVVKRTDTAGGAFVRFNPKNQETNYWRCGSSVEADKFIIYKGGVGDIVEVEHASTNDGLNIVGAKGASVKASGASGDISISSNSGGSARGLWLGAHGTATSGKWAVSVDANNNVTLNGNAATATTATTANTASAAKAGSTLANDINAKLTYVGEDGYDIVAKTANGDVISKFGVPNSARWNGWELSVGAAPTTYKAGTIYFITG